LNARPNLSLHVKLLNVGSYGIPPTSNQKAGPVPLKDCLNVDCAGQGSDPYAPEQESTLDSSDTRPLTAVYANGSVYSALDTAMQVAGNVEAGFQWFNISTQASSPRVVKHGYFGVAHGNAIFPAIATDASGHGYISYTLSGDNWYPSAAYSTFSAGPGSAANIAGVGAAPEDGFCGYLFFNCAQTDTPAIRPRWGDYGYAAWDGSRFFVANEFIGHSCSYATFNNDPTCGATRTFYGNFSTHITQRH
ncbi:MAG: hypothetical protein QOC82_3729, partial [Frankiaceae bacterium]|nr:hypothetical protein [Frankiaceae bacterium]